METVLDKIRAKAKTLGRKICLTESDDPRNLKAAEIMVATGVAKSKGEARRLIEQGGVSVDDSKVTDVNMPIPATEFVLHKGKKVHLKVVVK